MTTVDPADYAASTEPALTREALQAAIEKVRDAPLNTRPRGDTVGELTEYVVGFAFDWYGRVALIRKNRPAWQAGRLNGIGGHVEPGEHPDDAMPREFEEETGVLLEGWEKFAVMDFPGARIHFYRLVGVAATVMDRVATTTDEEVFVCYPPTDKRWVIPNLLWLLPLAAYTADRYETINVRAQLAEEVGR